MNRGAAGSALTVALVAALAAGPGAAHAQQGNGGAVTSVPEGPPVSSSPHVAVPDEALPAPDLPGSGAVPSGPAGQVSPRSAGNPQVTAPAAAPQQIKPIWDPRQVAILDVLDKADGAVSRVSAPVGSSFTEGRLKVTIGACVVRPDDMAPDAAIYMTVKAMGSASRDPGDAAAREASLFRGWLIRSEPGATVVGDGSVTFRVIGCKAG